MKNETKQSVIELLEAAKEHVLSGEKELAVGKIDEAISELANDGVSPASDGEEVPPLPGTGSTGGL